MTSKVISQDLPVPTLSPGFADIVGFGLDGVVIMRNSVNVKASNAIQNFGYNAGGWRIERHVRLLGDTTGNKAADIVGFGEQYVFISVNNGNNTFRPAQAVLNDFTYSAGGWRIDKHIRFVADINNTGLCDIVGFGDGGVLVARNNGNLNFSSGILALKDLGYNAGGWRLDKHLRFLADVTGDGRLDIVGFGDQHVFIARNNGNYTFAPVQAVINNFCIGAGGWQINRHPRFVADLTGDGRADILGCGDAGVYVSLNNGTGSFGPVTLAVNNFGTAQGWQVDKHPRFVADLTGKKRGDIIGFGDAGVYVSYNNGNGTFQPAKFVLNNFGVQQGWSVAKHPRFVADITGDGCADIIGFGDNSVWVAFNNGSGGFGPATKLIDNFVGASWTLDKTVRFVTNLGGRF
jgi:hypothetical protein